MPPLNMPLTVQVFRFDDDVYERWSVNNQMHEAASLKTGQLTRFCLDKEYETVDDMEFFGWFILVNDVPFTLSAFNKSDPIWTIWATDKQAAASLEKLITESVCPSTVDESPFTVVESPLDEGLFTVVESSLDEGPWRIKPQRSDEPGVIAKWCLTDQMHEAASLKTIQLTKFVGREYETVDMEDGTKVYRWFILVNDVPFTIASFNTGDPMITAINGDNALAWTIWATDKKQAVKLEKVITRCEPCR